MRLIVAVFAVCLGLSQAARCRYGGTLTCPNRIFIQQFTENALNTGFFDAEVLLFNTNLNTEFLHQRNVYTLTLEGINNGASQSYQNIEEIVGTMHAIFMNTYDHHCVIPVTGELFEIIEAAFDRILLKFFDAFRRTSNSAPPNCPPREQIQQTIFTSLTTGSIDTDAMINNPSQAYRDTFGLVADGQAMITPQINAGDIKEVKTIMERQEMFLELYTDILEESCFTMIRSEMWTQIELDFDKTAERFIGQLQAKTGQPCPMCIRCRPRNAIKAVLDAAVVSGNLNLLNLLTNSAFSQPLQSLGNRVIRLRNRAQTGGTTIQFIVDEMNSIQRDFLFEIAGCYINVRAPMEDVITKAFRDLKNAFIDQLVQQGGAVAGCPNRATLVSAINGALAPVNPTTFDGLNLLQTLSEFSALRQSYNIFISGIQRGTLFNTGNLVQEFNKIANFYISILGNRCFIDTTTDVKDLVYESFDWRNICSTIGGIQNPVGP